jgi:hypothetical protein
MANSFGPDAALATGLLVAWRGLLTARPFWKPQECDRVEGLRFVRARRPSRLSAPGRAASSNGPPPGQIGALVLGGENKRARQPNTTDCSRQTESAARRSAWRNQRQWTPFNSAISGVQDRWQARGPRGPAYSMTRCCGWPRPFRAQYVSTCSVIRQWGLARPR